MSSRSQFLYLIVFFHMEKIISLFNSNYPTTSRVDQLGTSCTEDFLMCYLMTVLVDDRVSDR